MTVKKIICFSRTLIDIFMILYNLGYATSTTNLISLFSTVEPIRAVCSERCLRTRITSYLGYTLQNDQCHWRGNGIINVGKHEPAV